MAEVEFHLHNEVGIKFPPLRPAYSDGELYFDRFCGLEARSTGTSIIGEGGTGRIHLVRDELMERQVALKIPLDSILRDPAAREDVIQETRQAMELTHPNIVRIHDFHEGGAKWGISMQYVRGKNLDEWRYENEVSGFRRAIRPYTVEAIRDWISQLCDALRYAHEDARMVHRDIKPKNLMLEKRDGGEKLYVTDFGITQRLRQHTMMLSRDQSKAGESKGNMGTLPYMPWEQISGAAASPLDDIYAVGATIYELITGRPPFYDGGFEQIKVQIREVAPPSMEQRILDLGLHMPPPPEEWEQVVAACLAKRPEDRPQSIRAVAAALGFQSGSNTELETKVSVQAERINELENRIISIGEGSAHEAEMLGRLEELQQQIELSNDQIKQLEGTLGESRRTHELLTERLQSAESDRDAALQGGDLALQSFREDSVKRIASAEERVTELKEELDRAKVAGEALAKEARLAAQKQIEDLEAKLDAARNDDGDAALAIRKETEQAIQAARNEVEQINERLRKSEQSKEDAIRQAREEGEKRLQRQADELEKTRQSLSTLVHQKDHLERAVATEKERQGASLKPLLISLLVAVALGLGGGYLSSALRSSPASEMSQELLSYLPKEVDSIAAKPVPFEWFERFASDIGVKTKDLGVSRSDDGSVQGVSGVVAMNFCNWLNQTVPPGEGLHYSLPGLKDLEGKVTEDRKEWTGEWDIEQAGQVMKVSEGKKGDDEFIPVHVIHRQDDFTFRIRLERISK